MRSARRAIAPCSAPFSTSIYLEPFTGDNLRAFGYDMFSEPVRQEAMQRAGDSGRAALSGMVTLIQESPGEGQPGFLIYNPIYRKGMPLATVDERRAALLGFAYSPFRAQALLARVSRHRTSMSRSRFSMGRPSPASCSSRQRRRRARPAT